MDLDRFIQTRQGAWRSLESALERAERSGLEQFDAPLLRDLGSLYRRACSDLVYARTVLQNADLTEYLNQLVGSAYAVIYRKARFSFGAAVRFLLHGFPASVRRHLVAIGLAFLILFGGLAVGAGAVTADREAFIYFVPSEYHQVYGEKPDDLRSRRFGNIDAERAAEFSSAIYTNNVKVSFLAFAAGISFGVLTSVLVFYNGALLGALAGNFHRWDMDLEFWSLILPHGAIEISCIAIAAGAGLVLAGALIRPGRRTRAEALAEAAREAVPMALGTAPCLVLAGLIEGFVTPMEGMGAWAKMGVGIVTGIAFWAWLLIPRRARG